MGKTPLSNLLFHIKNSTTLERVLVTFGIIMGVIGFYFVLSDINSVISTALKEDMNFSSRVTMLEKIQEKYQMNNKVYFKAKRTLFQEENQKGDIELRPFFQQFPRSLRQDLKYSVYSKNFELFAFTKYTEPLILNEIGDCMKRQTFRAG